MRAMYSADERRQLSTAEQGVIQRYHEVIVALSVRAYRTERAREFALQGFGRRLATLRECIRVVFDALPLDLEGLPSDEQRQLANIAAQAFLVNLFGAADDLAWLWAEQRDIRKPNGQPLSPKQIGMGPGYVRVRQSFPDAFRAYLDTRADWFAAMEAFRHALAHRIAPYIPPYAVAPANIAAHAALETDIETATRAHDFERVAALEAQQRALRFFRPWLTHSFGEDAPIMVLHPQMIADFNTIHEMAGQLLAVLGP